MYSGKRLVFHPLEQIKKQVESVGQGNGRSQSRKGCDLNLDLEIPSNIKIDSFSEEDKNYLKIHFKKSIQKGYDELPFDKKYPNHDRLFRMGLCLGVDRYKLESHASTLTKRSGAFSFMDRLFQGKSKKEILDYLTLFVRAYNLGFQSKKGLSDLESSVNFREHMDKDFPAQDELTTLFNNLVELFNVEQHKRELAEPDESHKNITSSKKTKRKKASVPIHTYSQEIFPAVSTPIPHTTVSQSNESFFAPPSSPKLENAFIPEIITLFSLGFSASAPTSQMLADYIVYNEYLMSRQQSALSVSNLGLFSDRSNVTNAESIKPTPLEAGPITITPDESKAFIEFGDVFAEEVLKQQTTNKPK